MYPLGWSERSTREFLAFSERERHGSCRLIEQMFDSQSEEPVCYDAIVRQAASDQGREQARGGEGEEGKGHENEAVSFEEASAIEEVGEPSQTPHTSGVEDSEQAGGEIERVAAYERCASERDARGRMVIARKRPASKRSRDEGRCRVGPDAGVVLRDAARRGSSGPLQTGAACSRAPALRALAPARSAPGGILPCPAPHRGAVARPLALIKSTPRPRTVKAPAHGCLDLAAGAGP